MKKIQALSKLISALSSEVKKPRIVFLGTPKFAVSILEYLANSDFLPILIITSPDAKKGRGMKITPPSVKVWAKKNNIDVLQPEKLKDKEFLTKISKLSPDLFIVASYGKIIPPELLAIPKNRTINVHPSLLPKYRGASPISSLILDGDKETGVTIMLVDEEMDHGSILSQQKLNMSIDNFTFLQLEENLAKLGGKLLIDTIPLWLSGKITPEKQVHASATYTKKIIKNDGHIDWNKTAEEILRKILALNPWPGTFTFYNKKRLVIKSAKILQNDKDKKPGEIFLFDDRLAVACGNGAILVEQLQIEGGKEINSKDFLLGNKNAVGNILS